jgi:hypothetical protein
MQKTKIFVSFDFDRDRVLKDFIVGQAKLADSPFNVSDYSLKEAAPQADWERKARLAISRADVFVVMLGSSTRRAAGVKKEVSMARGLGKPRIQIIGYRNGSRDWALPGAGRTYSWNWQNLKSVLVPTPRSFAERYFGS